MRRFLLVGAALAAWTGFPLVASAQLSRSALPPPGITGPTFGIGGLGAPPPGASSVTSPSATAPNSFVVHLNGRLNWYAGVAGTSADRFAGSKLDPFQLQGYIRLYPGFDAVAANGLKYGVVTEIRNPGSTFTGAGTTPGATSAANTLFWRRAYGYLGTDQLGTLRLGQGDGPITIFQTGVFEDFNDGGWDGDVPLFAPFAAEPIYPFTDVGALYTSNKAVYVSPAFSGFQFGIGFEPNTSNLVNTPGCSVAALTCNTLASSPVSGADARRRNTIDVGGRYAGIISGVGLNVGGAYIVSGKVDSPGPRFEGLSAADLGATVSYGGLTVGGNFVFGTTNALWALKPAGGQNALAFLFGGQYAIGPYVIGASYFKYKFAGNWTRGGTVARAETDQGYAAGGTYALAPGVALYLSWLYGQRHQAGWDFNAGAPGTAGNNTRANIFAVGTVWKW